MVSPARIAVLILLISLVCGCSGRKTLVALAPDPDGKTGSIVIGNDAGLVNINAPYHATTVAHTGAQPTIPENLGKQNLDRIFAEALSIQPKRPIHFLLYFKKDTILTSDSEKLLPDIIAAIRERNSIDISVIGHTDTVGSMEYNTELSSNRALVIKNALARAGVEAESIRTTSHGKENLLIQTGDNVNEPRNRRVEVVIR